jgi:hypothetical protein
MPDEQMDALKRIEHDLQVLIEKSDVRSWDYGTFKEMKEVISDIIYERKTMTEPK